MARRGKAVVPASSAETPPPAPPRPEELRARLTRERDTAIEQLRRFGISPNTDTARRPGDADEVRDEGDHAQASERQDMGFVGRQRLAERINRLTAALRRVEEGGYDRCVVCGDAIEPARLAALPEADTCLACQKRREL